MLYTLHIKSTHHLCCLHQTRLQAINSVIVCSVTLFNSKELVQSSHCTLKIISHVSPAYQKEGSYALSSPFPRVGHLETLHRTESGIACGAHGSGAMFPHVPAPLTCPIWNTSATPHHCRRAEDSTQPGSRLLAPTLWAGHGSCEVRTRFYAANAHGLFGDVDATISCR